jgi:hypothetical protein
LIFLEPSENIKGFCYLTHRMSVEIPANTTLAQVASAAYATAAHAADRAAIAAERASAANRAAAIAAERASAAVAAANRAAANARASSLRAIDSPRANARAGSIDDAYDHHIRDAEDDARIASAHAHAADVVASVASNRSVHAIACNDRAAERFNLAVDRLATAGSNVKDTYHDAAAVRDALQAEAEDDVRKADAAFAATTDAAYAAIATYNEASGSVAEAYAREAEAFARVAEAAANAAEYAAFAAR